MRQLIRTSWVAVALWGMITSSAVAEPPERVGPNGFLLWESPREVSEISFEAGDGTPLTLTTFGGKLILLNIWATWCLPCRIEMPSMERLYQEIGEDGFEIMAVSIDAELGGFDLAGRPGGDIQVFADSLGLTFPMLHDPSGGIERLYRTTGVPETFLIGRDGILYKKVAGGTEWDAPQHKELIQRLLAAPK